MPGKSQEEAPAPLIRGRSKGTLGPHTGPARLQSWPVPASGAVKARSQDVGLDSKQQPGQKDHRRVRSSSSLYSHCSADCQGQSGPLGLVALTSHLLPAAMQTGQDDPGALGSCPTASPGLAAPPQYLAASATWAPCPDPSSWAGPLPGWAQEAPLGPLPLAQTQGAPSQGLAAGLGSWQL